ncbi:CHY zinc finger protein [Guptibacillus hwajinpoensis]|uniref:CHY zinc finger n=2 Tax=Guptibacillus hwajinpoensis TaxID=208199 RepID=A0A0J6CSM9_9BACL|nr:CHY zinc finger protein [Alkalihalobacillus macyae]KMM36095.1 CHY zinc finger [Alkalihalobacillus macyae]
MNMNSIQIKGKLYDDETRCEHYHSYLDIVAIKFYCCNEYYPCITCHKETAGHEVHVWPDDKFNEKAVACGKCKTEMTIHDYLSSDSQCPYCKAKFNEGCKLHRHLYFQAENN